MTGWSQEGVGTVKDRGYVNRYSFFSISQSVEIRSGVW